ncbi:hypothetical protein J4Q44_G00362680 [Coregonus suidteri]|uniref:ZU5 domain-containing protein n=1 Tax=Coregonus suidteri TaxID=861788 RepID=A0AAN8KK39_9TELE
MEIATPGEGNVDIVTLLLARDATISLGNKSGLTPLHLAAQDDKVNVAEVLVNQGATVDPETKMGYTPLHVACHYGNVKMVNFLLKNQAKVNAKTKNTHTHSPSQAPSKVTPTSLGVLLQHGASPNHLTVNGNTALSIARRLGYISVVDTLKVVTEETQTTLTVTEKHNMNIPETMNEVLDMSDDEVGKANVPEMLNEDYLSDVEEGEDAMAGDMDKYLAPQDLRELGDDSLPQEGYVGFSIGARSASVRSFSSDRSNTLNRTSYTRDSMMIEEILTPTKDTGACKDMSFITEPQNKVASRDCDSNSLRHYSWTADTLDNINMVSSPIHSGFLVSFMVDARGGSMRGSRHNGMRIIIPPRKCTAPTRITCRLAKRHKLATPPPMVDGEGLASRLVEVGPAGAQFLGPVIVEIPHFGSMRGKERELIMLRSENGETWKEHQDDYKTDDLNELLNGMDEELDSAEDLEKKRICRIITKDFPQYFAVVSRIRQESSQMGPEGGVLSSLTLPLVQASFPEGALTKKIRVGLQAQPAPDDMVKKILGNRATFSPIVTVEPRRRKFHKPITMTIPVPPLSGEGVSNGYKGDSTPCLSLLCSITGGTSPAQWEDITGTTPLTFVNDCVSFTTNVSARFWLADCHQIPETVGLASQLYRELICVPYMAKFVVFAKMNDPMESHLRCFCMTDDKVDKTLEQQENFEEVARSKDIEVLEGRPIYVDCYGNLAPLTKAGQLLVLNFYAFKENRLPFCVKVRDNSQEPCGRLTFLKETTKTTKGLPQTAVCNLNITLPALKKTEKPERRHTFTSLALRKRYSYLAEPAMIKSSGDVASSPVRSYRTMDSPVKTVVQQAQYPVQVSASLVSSSSKPGADPVFIKGLSTPFSSRTTPASSTGSISLQERIQPTPPTATSNVRAAINEAERTFNSSGYGTLKSVSSSRRSDNSTSVYGSMRSQTSSTTSATYNTMTVPVYSFLDVVTESQVKKGPGSLKMSPADSRRSKTAVKSPPYITPPGLTLTPPSSLSSNQDILKDVADMKEDLIRMTAILQTDPRTARNVPSQTPKEPKMEDEEPFTIVEKVKEDLVKVSEILTKDVVSDSQACRGKPSEEEWEEFSKDELEEAQQSAEEFFHPPFDANTLSFRPQSMPSKEFNLAQVVDYLANDIGASSLSKMAEMKSRYEEVKREGEDKQKLKKLKMPPPPGMRTSASEKDLCKLAETYNGPDAILESPEDFSHEQDKSPLSDSGFETRSEKTPSAPQSAESTGPKPPFTDPIPPCITETRTEVVHIRSYERPDGPGEALMEEAASASPACIEPEVSAAFIKDKVKSFQMKVSDDSDSVVSKSMRLKEETHITTTTRMVYHKPQLKDGSERIEETMSVRDIMKAFQSGRDPSKELAGLFEHKAGQDSVKGDELTPRFLDNDTKANRIMEVHIEKEGNTFQPTEVIIRETKNHPDSYFYKGDSRIQELPNYNEAQQEGEELTADDSRPSSAQLMADDSYHDDELSELRGESYRFAEKMLHSEKLDIAHSDTEDSMADQTHRMTSESHGAESDYGEKGAVPRKEFTFKSSKDTSFKSGKCSHKDDQFDKVTVLHYTAEPGSPKHAVWMRFTEDKLDRNREKLIYEDRVDQTVKEAEEKLSEVSQFFRDKTEKLNDELQSPEKKPPKRDPRETRSGPSSTCGSPEKTQQKAKAEGEEWGKGRGNILFSSTTERKSSSLPNSPERAVLSRFSEETSKQQTKVEEWSEPSHVKASFSRVSSVRMKFESEAQNQDKSSSQLVQSTPPVSRLQESKLPVDQLFTGGKTTKGSEATEEGSPSKKSPEKPKGPASNSSKSVVSSAAPKQSGDKRTNKNLLYTTAQKHPTDYGDAPNKNVRKRPESQIPVRSVSSHSDSDQSKKAKQDTVIKPSEKTSQIPILTMNRMQVGRQGEREGRGGVLYKQKQPSSPQASPDDDTLEQVSFIDSSGKSPLTPETPSSEEVSYDLTSRTPDSILGFMPFQPSPIPEVSEDSSEEEQGQDFSFKDFPPERPNVTAADLKNGNHQAGQTPKDKGVAYIQFPPPPPLDSEQSSPEKKKKEGSCGSLETEMMEVNLQEEHDKHFLTEPIIRVQPPSPVPPGADNSDSSDDESVFQPLSFKKYTFKISEGQEQEDKSGSKSPKQDKNRNNKEPGTNRTNGSNGIYEAGKTVEYDSEQNGNDQSITDCSIASTPEFSHDTDATEIDSLDGYDMQDEDDGLCEMDTKPFSLPDSRKDVWASDSMLRSCDRSFSQTKLEVIEEEKTPEEECRKAQAKSDPVDIKTDGASSQDQKDKDGFSDTYFSYKLEEAFDSPFKTVATKGLDFDPWSSKGGDDEVVDARIKDDEPKPFGLAADDRSQATTPDTTPARTPTDDSTTPTSEPNPFPFHEGKMFEMTRSGAIDMSKRDIVEERLQFFQIGEHNSEGMSGGVRDWVRSTIQSTTPAPGIPSTTVCFDRSNGVKSKDSASNVDSKFSTFKIEFKTPSEGFR